MQIVEGLRGIFSYLKAKVSGEPIFAQDNITYGDERAVDTYDLVYRKWVEDYVGDPNAQIVEGIYVDSTTFTDYDNTPLDLHPEIIYVDTSLRKIFYYNSDIEELIELSLQIGETADTAHRGDHGKTAYEHSQEQGNPHNTQIGDIDGLEDALADAGKVKSVNDVLPDVAGNVEVGIGDIDGLQDELDDKLDGPIGFGLSVDGTGLRLGDNVTLLLPEIGLTNLNIVDASANFALATNVVTPLDFHNIILTPFYGLIGGKKSVIQLNHSGTGDRISLGNFDNPSGLMEGIIQAYGSHDFRYIHDYSTSFTDRSLVDKGYVDNSYVKKSGDIMTGQLELPAGSASTPSLKISPNNSIGFCRPGSNRLGLAMNGESIISWRQIGSAPNANVQQLTNQYSVRQTAANSPTYSFTQSTNTGFQLWDVGILGLSADGVCMANLSTTGFRIAPGSSSSEVPRARLDIGAGDELIPTIIVQESANLTTVPVAGAVEVIDGEFYLTNTDLERSPIVTNRIPREITISSYTLLKKDRNKRLKVTRTAGGSLTIPASTFKAGDAIVVVQGGSGQIEFIAGTGMTIEKSVSDSLFTAEQGAIVEIYFESANVCHIYGRLELL